jgi:hypothetical protein
MPAANLNDGYSEYIMMNSDLQGKSREELYEEVVRLRACIRVHRDYGLNHVENDYHLYMISLPENKTTKFNP